MSISTPEPKPEAGARGGPPRLVIVLARARNGVIGREGALPWRLKADLQHFKRVTKAKPLLMGRKTWESLPGLLPGRPHLVLTRDRGFRAEGAEIFHDLETMLARARVLAAENGVDEIAVIGGEAIVALTLPIADRLYLTEVEAEVEGDAYCPHIDEGDWREAERFRHEADTDNDHAFIVRVLDRAEPRPS